MSLTSQKALFQLPEDIHYLNGAYMSPLLKSVEAAGAVGMQQKRNPSAIRPRDFFDLAEVVAAKFAKLVHCKPEQVAIIPSASYGLQTAINNLPPGKGKFAITVAEEFPSDYYSISHWCNTHGKTLKVIQTPEATANKGEAWNTRILEAINEDTAVVVMSSIHWANGTRFDLEKIGARCKAVGAAFIVDGTQSVGALPIDVEACQIDALICAAYKWLLGPYSIGLAYYSDLFKEGIPIEQSWMNRTNAADFTSLTNYVDTYKSGAARYHVGEFSNFILLPMLDAALAQILEWEVAAIQAYCGKLIEPLVQFLETQDCYVQPPAWRANHLLGFSLPASINTALMMESLQKRKVFVSLRGNSIRVSPNVYNTEEDIAVLIETLALANRMP